jgi:hypothetical protein
MTQSHAGIDGAFAFCQRKSPPELSIDSRA